MYMYLEMIAMDTSNGKSLKIGCARRSGTLQKQVVRKRVDRVKRC